jgi:signal transduction histidine kinase
LFDRVGEFAAAEPEAFIEASERVGLPEPTRERLRRGYRRRLADRGLDPETDLVADNELARQAHEHIEGFSRYINLTVEELDRHLLGGVGVWEPEIVRASEAWREAVALLEIRLKSAGASTSESLEAARDEATVDRRALVHVFVNLIKNAVEAMKDWPGERRIQFQTVDAPDRLICRVRNTGPPIDAKLLEQWFHRGFTTKSGAGRGTGLAFVADTVRRMGASIAARSNSEEGTVLELSFPRPTPPTEVA